MSRKICFSLEKFRFADDKLQRNEAQEQHPDTFTRRGGWRDTDNCVSSKRGAASRNRVIAYTEVLFPASLPPELDKWTELWAVWKNRGAYLLMLLHEISSYTCVVSRQSIRIQLSHTISRNRSIRTLDACYNYAADIVIVLYETARRVKLEIQKKGNF